MSGRHILLVRHGTHEEVGRVLSGRSEIALNAAGQAEVRALARRLIDTPIRSLHTSPRLRARETMAAVAEDHSLPVRIAPALDEVDFGRFTGRSFAELDGGPDWTRWNAERATFRCPGGETMAEATTRALSYLQAIDPDALPALCVSHCDVIRGVVAATLGIDYGRMFQFDCDPASLTVLERTDWGLRVVTVNERPR